MIDLVEYYKENVAKNEYYLNKFSLPNIITKFTILDEIEAEREFKNLIQPYNSRRDTIKVDQEDDEKFIYLCFYLQNIGVYIKEIPDYLLRPLSRWDLSYDKIRNTLIVNGKSYGGIVSWQDRRIYIENIRFCQNENIIIDEKLNHIMKSISTRSADFLAMSTDEKLKGICNCIEFLLKKAGSFIQLDYENSCSYLSDEVVKKYRNKLECFRHSTDEALAERNSYNRKQKSFLIEYGIMILNFIIMNSN